MSDFAHTIEQRYLGVALGASATVIHVMQPTEVEDVFMPLCGRGRDSVFFVRSPGSFLPNTAAHLCNRCADRLRKEPHE